MTRINVRITRRKFLRTATAAAAAAALPACRSNYSKAGSLAANDVLHDLSRDPVIKKLRSGELNFKHKSMEVMTPTGKDAFSIIQRGLFALELIDDNPNRFNFGVYGPQTAKAVKYLQGWTELEPASGRDGRTFDTATERALEAALEQKINNQWIPPRNI
ncbi:twin-arginine translocation signal domain-containing protein [Candidatus Margulisiibacteriota bacterium]